MAIGPVFARSDFPRLYAQRLAFINMLVGPDKWPEVDQQWMRYFNLENSSRLREEYLMWGGLGSFNLILENEAVSYDNIVQGPKKLFTHALYGLGYQIGYLSAKHDLDGIVRKHAPELGRAQRMTVQTQAASFWNGSFTTELTADGLSYFNASHTLLRGGSTFANRPSTDVTLGQSSLETGLVAFRKQVDLMGNPQPLRPSRLLTAPDLEPIVHELLKSRLRHDTTTHAESFVSGKLSAESWPFLTSTTAWMILGPQKDLHVHWFWNIKPETTHGFDFDTAAAKTKTLYAASWGAVDPRGSYGSTGA